MVDAPINVPVINTCTPMKKIFILLSVVFALFAGATLAHAAQYFPMAPIPGVTDRGQVVGLGSYLNTLFFLLIAVAATFAVVKITVSGLRYMMSEAFGSKASALSDIQSSLIGLVILLATYVILATINPCLVNFNIITGSDACGEIRESNLNLGGDPNEDDGPRTPFTRTTYCAQQNMTTNTNNRGETICSSPVSEGSLAATQRNCTEAGGTSSYNGLGGVLDGLVGTHWCTFESQFSTGGGMRDREEVPSEVVAECEAQGMVSYRQQEGNVGGLQCESLQTVQNYWNGAATIGASTRLPQSTAAIQAFQEGCASASNGIVTALGDANAALTCLSVDSATDIYTNSNAGIGSSFVRYQGNNPELAVSYQNLYSIFNSECRASGGTPSTSTDGTTVSCNS